MALYPHLINCSPSSEGSILRKPGESESLGNTIGYREVPLGRLGYIDTDHDLEYVLDLEPKSGQHVAAPSTSSFAPYIGPTKAIHSLGELDCRTGDGCFRARRRGDVARLER
jgi:hypothetical protein